MLKWSMVERGNRKGVVLTGDLDDGAVESLLELGRALVPGSYTFDCGRIRRINSVGAAAWMTLVRNIAAGVDYDFERCASVFVEYFTMIPGMTGRGAVRSFFGSFECANCGHQSEFEISCAELAAAGGYAHTKCTECGGVLEADMPVDEILAHPAVSKSVGGA